MKTFGSVVSVCGMILTALAAPAMADTGLIAGDSLGVGVGMASHLKYVARNSVSIRAGTALQQIREAAPNSTLFLSLGTNDAVGSIDGLDGGIDRILAAAKEQQVKLVWIGPPCVFKPWDKNAVALDGILRTRLKAAGITYVSMRDDTLCSRSVRGGDGVHFNMRGYSHMWELARSAAGFTAEVSAVPPTTTRSLGAVKRKRHARRGRHGHTHVAAAPAAPAPEAAAPAAQ